jgi:hypothetical protein
VKLPTARFSTLELGNTEKTVHISTYCEPVLYPKALGSCQRVPANERFASHWSQCENKRMYG